MQISKAKRVSRKEFAFRLYSMSIGEVLDVEIEDDPYGNEFVEICAFRVPGGWTFGNVFVPWNNEFQEFAFSGAGNYLRLKCPKCLTKAKYEEKESFRENPDQYKCISCGNIIKYSPVFPDNYLRNKNEY